MLFKKALVLFITVSGSSSLKCIRYFKISAFTINIVLESFIPIAYCIMEILGLLGNVPMSILQTLFACTQPINICSLVSNALHFGHLFEFTIP